MTEKDRGHYSKLLEIFDHFELNDKSMRRIAYKPLHDYFQRLILEVGVKLCGLNQNSLKTCPLKSRWESIKYCLGYVEKPQIWESTINEMNNIRQKVEHNDYYIPKKEQLLKIRKKAPEFKDWIIRAAGEYYKKSKNFTFKEAFYNLSNWYTQEAEWLLQEYGENLPHVAKSDYSTDLEEYSYQQLSELVKALQERLKNIAKLEDIKHSDLEKLIQIVKIISDFKGKEEILLQYSICPKCGGTIKETQRYFGGAENDPEPKGVCIRVGCEKCDYELHSETINF